MLLGGFLLRTFGVLVTLPVVHSINYDISVPVRFVNWTTGLLADDLPLVWADSQNAREAGYLQPGALGGAWSPPEPGSMLDSVNAKAWTPTTTIASLKAASPLGTEKGPRDLALAFASLCRPNADLSSVLRQLALATILTRAGLGLDPAVLKAVCGNVFRLAFIPCFSEAAASAIVGRFLLGWDWAWTLMLGYDFM
ncbi:unnamed protein product [Protopolystoma xenopodis]|uniref:Uncharacterized protein n=1 Tax=Protopolystoma xenopodis TaxID=117903 RepID=A0A448WG40_9PLAT|nr:unnamed protein product [Protopolystoma xenopodis]